MREDERGFTLVEILAAVVILGILSLVAIVSVNGVINKAKEEHYNAAEDQFKIAAENYAQQNRKILPKVVGQKKQIKMSELIEKNYIKPIKDYGDNKCNPETSYVQIFKYSEKDYSYVAYLDCPSYNSKETISNNYPVITIEMTNPETSTSKVEAKIQINKKDKDKEIKEENKEKLVSWSYVIFLNGVEVKNSGSIEVKNYEKELDKTIDLSKYTPGKLQIVVSATNIYGLTKTVKSEVNDYDDKTSPKCIIKDVDINPKNWTKGPVKITVGCKDEGGVGCKKDEYTKTFVDSTEKGTIVIQDKAGNKTNCVVSVNIDKDKPTVPKVSMYKWKNNSTRPTSITGLTKYSENSWSKENIYVVANNSVDKGIGLSHYEYKITGAAPNTNDAKGSTKSIESNGTTKISFRACDKLGYCSNYTKEYTIKLDKEAPTCVSSGGSSEWTNKSRTLIGTCSDSYSGCVENISKVYSKNISSTNETPGYVKDKAGNTTLCPQNQVVKVDITPPTKPTSGSIGRVSGSNKNASISTAASGSTDNLSGVKEYRYYVKTSSGTPANTSSSFTTNRNYTRKCGQTNYAYAIAIDYAGNRSSVYSMGKSSDGNNTYSSWSQCSKTCGGGTKTRTNSCALVTNNLSASCNSQDCCSKTETIWGSYDKCSAKCDGGKKTRSGKKYSVYNDDYCGTTSETVSCNETSCCSDTRTVWNEDYSACDASCGWGTRKQYGTLYSNIDDSYCGSTSKRVDCYSEDDCCSDTRTEWERKGPCDVPCGYGTQIEYGSKYSNYNDDYCGRDERETTCYAGDCCSRESPYGCRAVSSCRIGTTTVYYTGPGSTGQTVTNNDKLYLTGYTKGEWIEFYREEPIHYWDEKTVSNYGFIRNNCLKDYDAPACPESQCTG